MNRLRALIRSFFGFSRLETNAFLILIPLMIVAIFSEPVYRYWFVRQPRDFSKERRELDSLMATWKWGNMDSISKPSIDVKLFSFNPNDVSKEQLDQLGFHNSIITRIFNYRQRGGKFITKNDLLKIYGMDTLLFKTLYAYINLPDKIVKESKVDKLEIKEKPKLEKFNLNTADTTQLIEIYGIGSKLSKRIIAYRDKLGGFISPNQLNEVFGLDSTVVHELVRKSFIDNNFLPVQIDINNATQQELAVHPYVKYKLAKAITAYRFQHGAFQSIEDLRKSTLIDEQKFQQIKPYLSVKP